MIHSAIIYLRNECTDFIPIKILMCIFYPGKLLLCLVGPFQMSLIFVLAEFKQDRLCRKTGYQCGPGFITAQN